MHFALITHDADVVLHHFLQIALNGVWIFTATVFERLQRFAGVHVDLVVVDFAV